jgi:hypothetical protein
MNDVTRVLSAIEQGDAHAAEQLLPLVYDQLRNLAAAKRAQESPGQTLQATALVHEAYVRLVGAGDDPPHWDNERHFFAAAAEAMLVKSLDFLRRTRGMELHTLLLMGNLGSPSTGVRAGYARPSRSSLSTWAGTGAPRVKSIS